MMGKRNFDAYLISRFYPTREIRRIFDAREKCVWQYTVLVYGKNKKRSVNGPQEKLRRTKYTADFLS